MHRLYRVTDKQDGRGSGYKYLLADLVFSEPLDTVLIKLEKLGQYEDERYVVEVLEMEYGASNTPE